MKNLNTLLLLVILAFSGGLMQAQNFALQFDGVNDKIGVLDSPELNPTSALTLELWINADAWAGSIWGACLISKQGTNPDKGYGLTVGENGRVEFNHSMNESWTPVQTGQILGLNSWYHIAGVYTGTEMLLYVNGILQATAGVQGSLTPATGVVMNFADNPTWPGRFFTGKMDEIRIWEVARTEAEIQENMTVELSGNEAGLVGYWNMNEGTGTSLGDGSGNDNNGILLNMDETDWVDGFMPPGADVGVLGIASPSIIGAGFTAEEYIKLDVKNFSTEEVSGFTISYQIDGGDEVSEIVNEILPPFSSIVISFSEPLDLSAFSEVEISGSVYLDGDSNPENDALTETIAQTTDYLLFDQEQHNFSSAGQTHFNTIYMPEDLIAYEHIFIHVDLECPSGGCDPWDQPAMLYILQEGTPLEIIRYITPFGVACGNWVWDITDYKPLMTGKTVFQSIIRVWGASGWLVNMELEFVPGEPEYPYIKIDPLWNENNWVYGDPGINYDLPEVSLPIAAETEAAKIRMTISGHGQGNTMNAAEFAEFTHHFWIDGNETFDMHLWKDDCAENACSPQSGTYQYSRSGWCPGQDIQAWEYNLEGLFTPGSDMNIDFVLAEYTNLLNTGYNGGSHTEPHFRVHAYLLQYSSEMFVGMEDHKVKDNNGYFEVYPNPSTGVFNISGTETEIGSIRILRIDGSLVGIENPGNVKHYTLNLSDQPAGIYFLEVQTSAGVSVVKVAKR